MFVFPFGGESGLEGAGLPLRGPAGHPGRVAVLGRPPEAGSPPAPTGPHQAHPHPGRQARPAEPPVGAPEGPDGSAVGEARAGRRPARGPPQLAGREAGAAHDEVCRAVAGARAQRRIGGLAVLPVLLLGASAGALSHRRAALLAQVMSRRCFVDPD